MTPSTQKSDQKPIAFALLLNGAVVPNAFFNLTIRPSDYDRRDPSRGNVQQSAGRIWDDNWGLGVPQTSIHGNTGWRGNATADGAQLFNNLRENIYIQWHTLRKAQQALGQDPDMVECIFLDILNGFSEVVAWLPDGFRLRRSRSQPLLYQYSMQFYTLRDASQVGAALAQKLSVDVPTPPSTTVSQTAVNALQNTINSRTGIAEQVRAAVAPEARVLADMATASVNVLKAVQSAVALGVDAYDGVTAPLIYAATQIETAGRNLTQVLVEPLAITETIKRSMRELYGSYSEALCNLSNAFVPVGQYLDFTGLFGASNCSSTTGGRPQSPYADENPFQLLYTSNPPPAPISNDMQNALNQANGDALVLANQSTDYKLGLVSAINAGLPKS